jgi:hypothetical protein
MEGGVVWGYSKFYSEEVYDLHSSSDDVRMIK